MLFRVQCVASCSNEVGWEGLGGHRITYILMTVYSVDLLHRVVSLINVFYNKIYLG